MDSSQYDTENDRSCQPSSAILIRINPWEVPYIWEFVHKDLERAVIHNNGEAGMDDIWKALVTGAHSLWVVWKEQEIKLCFTTFIHDYEKKRVFFVSLLAGKGVSEFAFLEDQLADYARSVGCVSIESFVIPRVAALFQSLLPAYENTHLILEKKL